MYRTDWGLDYPPLTAYHSWLLAQLGHLYNPSFVALRPPLLTDHTGWGDLHECLKLFLRFTVLGSDLILWIPVVLVYSFVVFRPQQPKLDSSTGRSSVFRSTSTLNGTTSAIYSAMLLLLNPNLILIDNGHFQYNSIMLGLTLASAVSFHLNRDLLGAALYVCSMCFKQMALYYSPAMLVPFLISPSDLDLGLITLTTHSALQDSPISLVNVSTYAIRRVQHCFSRLPSSRSSAWPSPFCPSPSLHLSQSPFFKQSIESFLLLAACSKTRWPTSGVQPTW